MRMSSLFFRYSFFRNTTSGKIYIEIFMSKFNLWVKSPFSGPLRDLPGSTQKSKHDTLIDFEIHPLYSCESGCISKSMSVTKG